MTLKSISDFRFAIVITLIIFLIGAAADIAVPNVAYSQSFPSAPNSDINIANNKAVIITFDDGYKSQYTNAKPILDKYGYKATYYIVCNYVGNGELDHPNARMSWEDITELYKEGYDIGSHTMSHANLDLLSEKGMEYEIGGSKQCLLDHGINPISFAYPINTGAEDATVVNSQAIYNTDGTINAIPILIWHRIDNSGEGYPEVYATTIDLFEKEIKYLHDNGFKVLTMADLGYDANSNYLYLKR